MIMKKGNDLIHQVIQEVDLPSSSSRIEAGSLSDSDKIALGDSINEIFTIFQLNYGNQFFAAFANPQDQTLAKRMWMNSLACFAPEQILGAAKCAIEQCQYLPNLNQMMNLCYEQGHHGLPSARDAYIEACNARSPKAAHNWSHPAVYYAGKKAGWFTLSSETERVAFPAFERKYRDLCQRVLDGEELVVKGPQLLTEKPSKPLTNSENQARLKTLKKLLR
jgi:hypothetical protein